jgi:gliding motility-associated-like protein
MRTFFTVSFLLIFFAAAQGQKMFVAMGNNMGLKKVNVTSTGCISNNVIACSDQDYYSIALYKDTFYYCSNTVLFAGSIRNDTISNCNALVITPATMTSLTVDNTGVLYGANGPNLYRYVPGSPGFDFLGSMPYQSAGDMIFYEGQLYMASPTGIIKVDIANPPNSSMYIPINSQSIFGMAVLSVDCNLNKVYAFETINAGDATNVIELDIPNAQVVGTVCTLPFGVADAASDVEGGTFAGISIKQIDIVPQCHVPGKAAIHVIREPGQGLYNYLLNGTVTNTTGVFENLDPGTYRIEITTTGTCYLDTTVDVPVQNPVIPVVQEHHINPDCISGGRVWFTISPDDGKNMVIYNNDTTTASFQFVDLDEGLHHFSIVDQYYCEIGAKDIRLALEGSCDTVYFPSAFTPNNDGRNDLFRGSGNRAIQNFHLVVYNRWGQKVYETNNIMNGWDGKLGGIDQASGLYIWIASYATKDGVAKKRKGTMVLIR